VFALLLLLSCVAKKEAKQATRRLTALRVPSPARKNGRDYAALSRFSVCLGRQSIGGSQNKGELNGYQTSFLIYDQKKGDPKAALKSIEMML